MLVRPGWEQRRSAPVLHKFSMWPVRSTNHFDMGAREIVRFGNGQNRETLTEMKTVGRCLREGWGSGGTSET